MTDETHKPNEQEIEKFMGETAKQAWTATRQFIEENYDFTPETIFYGAKYGWTIRYRKSGKTLCSLFPENGGFTALIVLGKEESQKALSMTDEPRIRKIVENVKQYHDGRWLWIRLRITGDVEDAKKLLQIKRKPKKKP